jgi:hypothetical protein
MIFNKGSSVGASRTLQITFAAMDVLPAAGAKKMVKNPAQCSSISANAS